jgi:hypothetical protein
MERGPGFCLEWKGQLINNQPRWDGIETGYYLIDLYGCWHEAKIIKVRPETDYDKREFNVGEKILIIGEYPHEKNVYMLKQLILNLYLNNGICKHVAVKNTEHLFKVIFNKEYGEIVAPWNKISRQIFFDITGERLPKSLKKTKEFFEKE